MKVRCFCAILFSMRTIDLAVYTFKQPGVMLCLVVTEVCVDAFLDQHTNMLDHVQVDISSSASLCTAGLTAWIRDDVKTYDHRLGRDPVRSNKPRVVLRSAMPLRTS